MALQSLRIATAIAGASLVLALPATGFAAGSVGVSVSPSRLTIPGGTEQTLTISNPTGRTAVIRVGLGNYDILRNGRVVIDPARTPGRSARKWLRAKPRTLTLGPGERGRVRVAALPNRVAAPGDHQALVLMSSGGRRQGRLAVQARVGVPVQVRVGGALRRNLKVHRLSLAKAGRRRVFRIGVSNRGNLNERLPAGRVKVELRRRGRVVAKLTARRRELLPGRSGVITVPYRGRLRGRVTAVAIVRPASATETGPGVVAVPRPVRRAARVRL